MSYPWNIHLVWDGTLREGMVDAHTHGLDEFGSKELQFVLMYPQNYIGFLLNEVGDRIRNGLVLEDGMLLDGLCGDGAKIRVFETEDVYGEPVFRLVMPDGKYRFPEESDEAPYCNQYESPYIGRILDDDYCPYHGPVDF